MKYYYMINEVAKMYDISADSLRRYEEIGLLKPYRSDSGYRLYQMSELWVLNVIKDLRKLGFSYGDIKAYFQNRSVETSKDILKDQYEAIDRQIFELLKRKESIRRRIANIERYASVPPADQVEHVYFSRRRCLLDPAELTDAAEIDMGFRRVQARSNERIDLVGSNDLSVLISLAKVRNFDSDALADCVCPDIYDQAFCFIHANESIPADFILSEGMYFCLTYRGSHRLSVRAALHLLAHAHALGASVQGPLIEVCLIDTHETSYEEEYITQLQLFSGG